MYPGVAAETCTDYDPRTQTWYISAISGPKDVILVIDMSGNRRRRMRRRRMRRRMSRKRIRRRERDSGRTNYNDRSFY